MFAKMPSHSYYAYPFGQPPASTARPLSSSLYRPANPSPLSLSSPIPGPRSPNATESFSSRREISSSPLQSIIVDKKLSRFAGRSDNKTSRNPLIKKREDVQKCRRSLFLNNVRQRSEDRRWERRGGENEILKLEWQRFNRELRQTKDAELDGLLDLDRELEALGEEEKYDKVLNHEVGGEDLDSIILDQFEQQERAELEEVFAPATITTTSFFSGQDEYEDLFAEYALSQQQSQSTPNVQQSQSQGGGDKNTPMAMSQDVEMS